jgi:hypothetical protein
VRARLPAALSVVLAVANATAAEPVSKTEKGRAEVTIEKVEYKGWKNNLKLDNGDVELIVTLDVGPRVISYKLTSGKNVLKEYEDQLGKSGESEWMIRGGHRLWTSPEDTTRTYALDNAPVSYRELGPASVRLTPPPDAANGIQKEIDLTIKSTGTRVTLVHRITNVGTAPTELAVWSLSVMAPGGMEILPLPPRRPHPGSVKNARSAADFAPSLLISAWPFTDFQDPRWHFGSKFITLTQDAKRGATKLGLAQKPGVAGYLNAGTLFVKRFEYRDGQHYPDNGVNYETFTNEDMLEMESLGPLITLAPGKAVEHVETWDLFGGVGAAKTEADIEAKVASMLK